MIMVKHTWVLTGTIEESFSHAGTYIGYVCYLLLDLKENTISWIANCLVLIIHVDSLGYCFYTGGQWPNYSKNYNYTNIVYIKKFFFTFIKK